MPRASLKSPDAHDIAAFEESIMGKGLILWLLGVPGIAVIALLVFHVI
jgi:hypothetical protein